MASVLELVPRTAKAVDALNAAVDTLAERFGIVRPVALAGRDPELQRVRELESIGGFLAALVETPTDDADALRGETLRLRTELDAMTAERDALKAAQAVTAPKKQTPPKRTQGRAQPRA